jgi:hypothetical protein
MFDGKFWIHTHHCPLVDVTGRDLIMVNTYNYAAWFSFTRTKYLPGHMTVHSKVIHVVQIQVWILIKDKKDLIPRDDLLMS